MPPISSHDYEHNGILSAKTTTTGSASSSKAASLKAPLSRALSTSPNFLEVPSTSLRARRSSRDSAFSELSIDSDELHQSHSRPLLPIDSNEDWDANANSTLTSHFRASLSTFYVRNYGGLLVFVSMFFASGMNIGTRLLETPGPHGTPMHPFQILLVRQSITAACCTFYGLYTGSIPEFPLGPRAVRPLLLLRGLAGFFGIYGMYFSLLYLPLSEATVLTFLAPILTCYVCSYCMPGETFTKQQQLAGLISLFGVVFIAEPASLFKSSSPSSSTSTPSDSSTNPTPHQHLLAIAVAMLGVLGATGAITAIRAIGTRAHPFLSINYFSILCSLVSLGCLVVFPDVKFRLPSNLLEWALLAMLGGCGFIMQFLLTVGLAYGGAAVDDGGAGDLESDNGRRRRGRSKAAEARAEITRGSQTRATSMLYTQMLFALAGDKLFFGVSPSATSWIGSGLVLAGAIWVAAAKDQLKEEGEGRRGRAEERDGGQEVGFLAEDGDGDGDEDGAALELDELAPTKVEGPG